MNEDQIDLLISSTVEGDPEAWRRFETVAGDEVARWRQLAELQRDQASLGRAVNVATAVAEQVEMPALRLVPAPRSFTARATGWAGWALAAVLALALTIRIALPTLPGPMPTGGQTPVLTAGPTTAAQAFQAYLDLGRESGEVVGELPERLLLDTRPSPGGDGYELLYLRQVVERMKTPTLYRFDGQNERGQPTLTRWEQPVQGAM
jgi:hypothetical protein